MPIFQGNYTITNFRTKTRIDLDGGNKANGTKVHGWTSLTPEATEYPNQVWKIQYTDKNGVDSYTISNVGSGTYLEIKDGNGTDGTPGTCSEKGAGDKTATYQEWEFTKIDPTGCYKVRNSATQNYLDIDNGSTADGAKIQGWWGELDGNENQLWAFEQASLPYA
ncbi:ricin B lectin domain-containing protein [Mycena rosella]|uniref:Ricin B lectin domain-containing protein n=1 Tax=Mycena rosella TaxID=1033263 RepID=A0AAD7DK42_MYCRO|nr:ricin B lectin domain-containing protein [Mycena rosella]